MSVTFAHTSLSEIPIRLTLLKKKYPHIDLNTDSGQNIKLLYQIYKKKIQWNLPIKDTLGVEALNFVLYSELRLSADGRFEPLLYNVM